MSLSKTLPDRGILTALCVRCLDTVQAHDGLLASAFGEQAKQRYLVLARALDAYCTHLYIEWEQRVGVVATEKLKQPILCSRTMCRSSLAREEIPESAVKRPGPSTSNAARSSKACAHQHVAVTVDAKGYGMPPPPYEVNFATELHMIIRESKYLDRMGFQASVSISFVLP